MASDLGPDDIRKAVDSRMARSSAKADEDEAEETAPAPTGGRARLVPVVVGLVALAAFAGIVWYAYTWGLGRGEGGALPVVKAEDGPEKVRPEDPGGMEVRHQDKLVLNQGATEGEGAQVERLLPPPETPQPPEPAAEDEALAEPAAESAPDAAGGAATNGAAGGAEAAQAAAAPKAADLEPDMPAAPEPEADAEPKAETEPTGADDAADAGADGPVAESESEPAPEAEAAGASVGQLAQAEGRFLIQLASLTSREGAEREWARLRERHADLLAGAELTVERAEIEGKGTFYRVQTGPFPNRATAEDMCGLLKAADQACLVVRR